MQNPNPSPSPYPYPYPYPNSNRNRNPKPNLNPYPNQPLDTLTTPALQRVLDCNLIGPAVLAQEAAVQMRRHGWGRIVNVGSITSRVPLPSYSLLLTFYSLLLCSLLRTPCSIPPTRCY